MFVAILTIFKQTRSGRRKKFFGAKFVRDLFSAKLFFFFFHSLSHPGSLHKNFYRQLIFIYIYIVVHNMREGEKLTLELLLMTQIIGSVV